MKKRRTYNPRLVKATQSYYIQEIADLLGLHKNAVLRWVRDKGLSVIDNQKPYLVNGSDLIIFLNTQQKLRRCKCQPDEFYCLRCHAPRQALVGSITHSFITPTKLQIHAVCSYCQGQLKRIGNTATLAIFQQRYALQHEATIDDG